MPELPEVETVCRGLRLHCVGSRVRSVRVLRPGFIRGSRRPTDLFEGLTIAAVHRRGKHFALESQCGRAMMFHLGMSGSITVRAHRSRRLSHVHVIWILERDGRIFELHHRDPRRFGSVRTISSMALVRDQVWSRLGPDALSVSASELRRRFQGRRLAVKPALLDQSLIAGVGNIYADESLFESGLHPLRRAGSLAVPELERLVRRLRSILKRSIRSGGSTIRDHADAAGRPGNFQVAHRVYGRGGKPCLRCGSTLVRIVCSQRSTVFCPRCQPTRA